MNKMSLLEKCKKISIEKEIDFNTILITYFFDQFLKRLSLSEFKDNYIFKGGLFIYSLTNVKYRYTTDIDFSFKNKNVEIENLLFEIKSVLAINIEDGIDYQVIGYTEIKKNDEFGGFKIKIIAKMENMKIPFSIDVAGREPITPDAISHEYKTLVDNRCIKLKSYSIESVIAEKLETVVSKKTNNSRSKDFYDLYILFKLKSKNINKNNLKNAIKETFAYRKNEFIEEEIAQLLEYIKKDNDFLERWKRYADNNVFAKELFFQDVINSILDELKINEII